jgi:hypothetical protein
MKKTILSFVAICFATTTFAQIPNNGFENWTSVGSYSNPDNWDNLNSMTSSMSIYTCTKGTPGNVGAAYLKLVSKTVTGMGVMPGIAVSGVIDMMSYKPKSGFAYTSRPQDFVGMRQYMASGADVGYMGAYLTKWNNVTGVRDTIALAFQKLTGMAMNWTAFTMPFVYLSAATPDSAVVVLSASGSTPVNGSYLYLDNLSFSGSEQV